MYLSLLLLLQLRITNKADMTTRMLIVVAMNQLDPEIVIVRLCLLHNGHCTSSHGLDVVHVYYYTSTSTTTFHYC